MHNIYHYLSHVHTCVYALGCMHVRAYICIQRMYINGVHVYFCKGLHDHSDKQPTYCSGFLKQKIQNIIARTAEKVCVAESTTVEPCN